MIQLHQNAVKVTEKQLAKLNLADWVMEEKFKGIRVWFVKDLGYYRLITRGGEDITANFPHICELDWLPSISNIQLDCELFDPEVQDEVVSGWAMTINLDPDKVMNCLLKCFDILHYKGVSLEAYQQQERRAILEIVPMKGPLQLVEQFPAFDHRTYYEHILARNGEGIMLKNIYATYAQGRRQVGRWLKRKKRDSFDVVIMGFEPGKGKYLNTIGSVKVGQYVGGQLRYICNISGMSDNERDLIRDFPEKYLGKVLTVRAMEQDPNSLALIEPSWQFLRCDKRPEDCIALVIPAAG